MDIQYYKRTDQGDRNAQLLYRVKNDRVSYKDIKFLEEGWHPSEIYLDEISLYLTPITPEEAFLILL